MFILCVFQLFLCNGTVTDLYLLTYNTCEGMHKTYLHTLRYTLVQYIIIIIIIIFIIIIIIVLSY